MPYIKLQFRPGIDREATPYAAEGGWYDCDKIRFRMGYPETIGGWELVTPATFQGICRKLFPWSDLVGEVYLGFGTNLKYYLYAGGTISDITPIRETTAAGDATFAAVNGSSVLTVTDTAHGALRNDFVTFTDAASLGGQITADVLNQEYQVVTLIDDDTYTIDVSVAADASDTGNGGAGTIAEYQINTGNADAVVGTGWGVGPWSADPWGEPSAEGAVTAGLRTWSQDNFGEDLVINPAGGGIYYWDRTNGNNTRAVSLDTLAGANQAPTIANYVMVSDQDRHVLAFGCDDEFSIGTQDPLLIRFSDQENIAQWQTLTTNSAGSLRVSNGSKLISAVQTKREILVFTDTSVYSMQFVGPPFTFGIQFISGNVNIAGPNAMIAANDIVYWMSKGKFMMYDGRTREIPCTVKDYVFSNINDNQLQKVSASHISEFDEIWWTYPTGTECDRYVVYNYAQSVWYYGTFDRTAFIDRSLISKPIGTSSSGELYFHEEGMDDGSVNPPVGINAYIESNPQDVGDGDEFVFAHRVIPDLTFRKSTGSPLATITIKAHEFPGLAYDQTDDASVAQTQSSPIETYTKQVFVRVRGRAFAVRYSSDQTSTSWRIGAPRLEVRTDGRK